MGKTNNAKYKSEIAQNLVLNSALDSWLEGTSFASAASATYVADIFKYFKNGSMVHTLSRSTDVPTNAKIAKYSLDATVTTIDASIASGEYSLIDYQIEGNDLRRIKGRQFTISFKVKATKVGTYCVALRNSAQNRSYVAEYQINQSNTWETKEIVVSHDTTGAWNYDTSLGMIVSFVLAAGSSLQTTANTWTSGGFIATANQVNSCDFVSNSFRITEIKINPGRGAGDFVRAGRDENEESIRLSRFLQMHSHVTVTAQNTNLFTLFHALSIPMRDAPGIGLIGGAQLNIQGTNSFNQTATPTFTGGASTARSVLYTVQGFTHSLPNGHSAFAAVPVNNGVWLKYDARY